MNKNKQHQGHRYNDGKHRTDLIEPKALEEYVKVLTKGSIKYEDRNWEKGMDWSTCLASGLRHILAFMKGEDYDPETGLLHTAHAMCNMQFLTSYYYIYPQGDDRPKSWKRNYRIGLDVDDVLADFIGAYCKKFNKPAPTSWNFCYKMKKYLQDSPLEELRDFYLGLEPKVKSTDLTFDPVCYITARSIPSEITMEWLDMHGFPTLPVYSTGERSKVDVALEQKLDFFVDDSFKNFRELHNAGITCYLMDSTHNKHNDVGHFRINSLSDMNKIFN